MLALWRVAQAQEARLLGMPVADLSTLTMPGLGSVDVIHLCVDSGGCLAGLISIEPMNAAAGAVVQVETLVVAPSMQRRGIASMLLSAVLQRWPQHDVSVTTAIANAPALALYAGFGFRPLRFGSMGEAHVPVVKLLRTSGSAVTSGSDPAQSTDQRADADRPQR